MDEFIMQLKQVTEQLVGGINNTTDEQITAFIESREAIIAKMRLSESMSLFTKEQSASLKAIMEFDPIILARITWLKDQASEGLIKISKIRLQKDMYDPVYTADSLFFDKKK